MGLIFYTMLGAILGWIATIVRQASNSRALRRNVLSGIGGALAGAISSKMLTDKQNSLLGASSVEALLISLVGALALLASVNLLHRNKMR